MQTGGERGDPCNTPHDNTRKIANCASQNVLFYKGVRANFRIVEQFVEIPPFDKNKWGQVVEYLCKKMYKYAKWRWYEGQDNKIIGL